MRPVAICVPARNEADLIPRLVRSLSRQSGFSADSPLRLIVAANNCTDATVPVLRSLEKELRGGILDIEILDVHLPPHQAHVGFARRLAMDHGADRLERDGASDGVLITTDADATAAPDWVSANLDALARADLVGGRLMVAPENPSAEGRFDGLDRRIERYWAAVRALEDRLDPPLYDPAPRHGDHTGASLALSVSLYRKAGGLPTLPCGEDNALVSHIRCLGGRVRHCPRVEIAVSARVAGRVEGGMASEMQRRARLEADGHSYDLPPALFWRRLLERRAALRAAWRGSSLGGSALATSAAAFGLDHEDLECISPETCPNDIAFVERAMLRESQRIEALPALDVDRATADLEALALDLTERVGGHVS